MLNLRQHENATTKTIFLSFNNAMNQHLIGHIKSNWRVRSHVPNITNGELHIWAITLKDDAQLTQSIYRWLSPREKQKSARMINKRKRDYQIQARSWLRWLLAQYTQTTAKDIEYRYGKLGKPFLYSQDNPVFFNASDCQNLLLCAFSRVGELGIDVEVTPREVSYLNIAKKKYTQKEYQCIKRLPKEHQLDAFLAIWTRKEAYGKALGVGIRYPMNLINLCEDIANGKYQLNDSEHRRWYLNQFLKDNAIGCIVSSEPIEKVKFFQLDIEKVSL